MTATNAWSRLTGWRRIADAMWNSPNDPQIFGAIDIDAGPLLEYIDHARECGYHVTPTHVVGRAVAHAIRMVPDLNVQIRRGRARQRESIDIFFITAISGGHDLSGVKVRYLDDKTIVQLAAELDARARTLKQGDDREFRETKRLTDALPHWLLRRVLRATAFLTEDLALDLPALSLRREPFGSAMVTSVGMFGLPQGFAPLAWMYDVPLLVLVGELVDRAVVVDGVVRVRRVLPLTATIDHRYVDGWHVSRLMQAFRDFLAAPAIREAAAYGHATAPSPLLEQPMQRSSS